MEFVVSRRGTLGLRIAALLWSTMAVTPDPEDELGNERLGGDPAMISGLGRTARHVVNRCRRPIVLSRLTSPARPNA
jgi:hypothetical protein